MKASKRARTSTSTSKNVKSSSFVSGVLRKGQVTVFQLHQARILEEAAAKQKAFSRVREFLAEAAVESGVNFTDDDAINDLTTTTNANTTNADEQTQNSSSESDRTLTESDVEDRYAMIRMTCLRRIDHLCQTRLDHSPVISRLTSRQPNRVRRSDKRNRRQRLQLEARGWSLEIENLVNAYMSFIASNIKTPDSQPHMFVVTMIGVHEYDGDRLIPQYTDQSANVALLHQGLLGCAPSFPSVAFTLELLELYHLSRCRQSNFSIQAAARVFCSLHNITYTTTLRNQFSNTFDVYLDIRRRISQRIDDVLGRDEAWKIKYNCPSCSWKSPDEPPLNPARLHAMDGNNSLKRLRKAGMADERTFDSSLFISSDKVDRFENDVKKTKHSKGKGKKPIRDPPQQQNLDDQDVTMTPNTDPQPAAPTSNNSDIEMDGAGAGECEGGEKEVVTESSEKKGDDDNESGEKKGNDNDSDDEMTVCAEHWKAANEVREETIQIFDQTGVFICVCRHAIVEFVAEMKKMGEGSKYGLAVINELLEVYEEDQSLGYDLGCRMKETVKKSSLAVKAEQKRLQFAVDSFHGHAHHRLCQLNNLPLYLNGVGIEDFSTCERVFSSSNSAARLVRYASHYHWRQFIDLHYRQWNDDRYADLSKFLYENYRQALDIIAKFTPDVEKVKASLSITDDAFVRWRQEELDFISRRSKAPAYDAKKINYVHALDRLYIAEEIGEAIEKVHKITLDAEHLDDSDADYEDLDDDTAQHVAFLRKLTQRRRAVKKLEEELKITTRWTTENPEYIRTKKYLREKKFIGIVENLEGLVVRWLTELSKANLAETSYKLRRHISSAMAHRCQTIRTAIQKYNEVAPLLNPPRPKLSYKEVLSFTMLGEFEFLKYTSEDILSKPWSVNKNREVAAKYFKMVRAREELVRLNVEVNRLRAWVDYDDAQWLTASTDLKATNYDLAYQIEERRLRQLRINNVHRKYIRKIYSLTGYTGKKVSMTVPEVTGRREPKDEGDVPLVGEDDAAADEMGRLSEFVEALGD